MDPVPFVFPSSKKLSSTGTTSCVKVKDFDGFEDIDIMVAHGPSREGGTGILAQFVDVENL